ncbi:MAG: ABC transporter permease [Colwellia sp.]|nr:ABC transporter permease [Colwellia sp.]
MNDILYISGQYIRHHRKKLMLLVGAVALVIWLPIAIYTIVQQTSVQLLSRAEQTPLVLGANGSPLELALGSLYFRAKSEKTIPYSEVKKIQQGSLANAIPLYYRFNAQNHPIVGTNNQYFSYRQLELAQGRFIAILGEAVLGSKVAREMNLSLGDFVISSPESAFDLAGVYPLKMKVVGLLKPSFSSDDEAIFVDVKTTWVIQGLGHGHQDLTTTKSQASILKVQENNIIANASLRQYNEITANNLSSYHFHGNSADYPISAIIPVPHSTKAETLLLGQYKTEQPQLLIVRSKKVIKELLSTVFTVSHYIIASMFIITLATGVVAFLVFSLSLQLRKNERFTLARIGASKQQIHFIMAIEVITVIVFGSLLAVVLSVLTNQYGISLIQNIIVS